MSIFSPFATAALMLAATAACSYMLDWRTPAKLAAPLSSIERVFGDWRSDGEPSLAPAGMDVLSPTEYLSRVYRKGETGAALFVAYFANQRAGETMHSPKVCLPGAGWEIGDREVATVRTPGGDTYEINDYRIQNAGRKLRVLYWYQAAGRVIRSEYTGKVLLVADSMFGQRTDGAMVRLTLPDSDDARQDGVELASRIIPAVQRCFGNR